MNTSVPASVLVVEDTRLYREAFCELLAYCFPNVRITAVEDASTALNITRQEDFDIIILDYHLPSITGGDVVRHLRRRAQTTDFRLPPIVLMSTQPDVAVFARSMGAAAFLGKPAMAEDMLAVIGPLLDGPAPIQLEVGRPVAPRRLADGRPRLRAVAGMQTD